MKKKILIAVTIMLLLMTGAFIGWLIYDSFQEEKEIEYADIDSMIQENESTAFVFPENEDIRPMNIKGYIIDPEKDLTDRIDEVFEKVDTIQPNTVLIKYSNNRLGELIEAAKAEGLDVILLLPSGMLNEKDITSVCGNYDISMVCVATDDIGTAENLSKTLSEADIVLGLYTTENLDDAKKTAVKNSVIGFWFVQIDSTAAGNAENIIKSWSAVAFETDSKIYGVLRNDKVTRDNPKEIPTLLRLTYNYGGFSGCIIYDREKLSTDDNKTATNLYSYYEYFNDIDYTALTLTDVSFSNDKKSLTFKGTSDKEFPVFAWSSAGGWISPVNSSDDKGNFTVSIPLTDGENKVIIRHKNALCTYDIDVAVDVMTSCSTVCDGEKAVMTATALKDAVVYASVANTYPVQLTKTSEDGAYATFTAEYTLSREMSLLTPSQVSFAATCNGLNDIVMCNQEKTVSPYEDNGLGRADICFVTKDYAETTSTAAEDDSSDPTCTPQMSGTFSPVTSYTMQDNHIICITDTGMKIHADDTRLILNGYMMPLNSINLDSISTENGTTLTFTPTYPGFIKLIAAPQEYHKGYLERIYNVGEFTAEYIDVLFMDTAACSYTSEPDFSSSRIFSSAQWYTNEETNTITLRLNLREKGSFNGYSYRIEDGKIILEFKNNPSSLTGTVIMLDPGHGGYGSPGTNYKMEVYEETVTYSIAMKAAEILRAEGATVIVTRSENDALSLAQRVKIARNENPDMFVSIHCDGADDTSWMGTHTFYYKNYSMPLAKSIHEQLVNAWRNYYYTDTASKEYATLDRKIKFFPFNVTRIEECPSVLVECGYLTNELDGQFLISEGGQQILATAIAQGIIDYIANY